MIRDNDIIAQKERGMFSYVDCSYYSSFSESYGECNGHSMEHVTYPDSLWVFANCITIHFMTEMGAESICSDDSVTPDSDTNDNKTITLLSKDRLFYNFMVDTLDAGNTCNATKNAVTFSPDNCGMYIRYVRTSHAGSRCAYNTSRTDSDTKSYYGDCLHYRLMKSLGADSVCARMTLAYMCSLFHFMKEWLQEAGVSTDNTMILDNDIIAQKERGMFSYIDCSQYSWFSEAYGECDGHSMEHVADPDYLWLFAGCITTHFMTEMDAESRCSDDSVTPDSDTNDNKMITLLSKDRLFYNFMVDALDAGNTCNATKNAVTFSPDNCGMYIRYVRTSHAGSRCAYNTSRTDSDTKSYYGDCLHYRLMKSLGADSVCAVNRMTLAYMCSLFHFMKEWLQEAGVSTDNTMIRDNDIIAQKERGMFSYVDCSYYSSFSESYGECNGHSMEHVTYPDSLWAFANCITIHFMTEMGAESICFDDSVTPDSDTNDKTITLLSKDRLFYNFMVDKLDAGNTCQAKKDAVTLSTDNCRKYIDYVRNFHVGSRCTYNTSSTDSDTKLYYGYCLGHGYRLMKSLGADSVCAVNRMTLAYMCSLFGFMKELLLEAGVSTDNTMIRDNDIIAQKERGMFSYVDCNDYSWFNENYSECVGHSMEHVTYPDYLWVFANCITTHFMTEMGAERSCSDVSVTPDSDTNDSKKVTLLSKDRLFYNFMVNKLDAGNTCQARKNAVTLSTNNCDLYIYYVRNFHAASRCTYKTSSTDNDTKLHYGSCLDYRLMKSLGADSVCQVSLINTCDRYHNMVQSLVPTCICVIGLIGNLLSVYMFGSGAIETPAAYQLLWLAGIDITFILTWWTVEVLPDILRYYSPYYRLTPYQASIVSVLTVCLRPLSYATRSCTAWLTDLIGLYRYLAVCKPYGNLLAHCKQHGHKYVVLVVTLSFLYSIPYFCEYYLDYRYADKSRISEDYYYPMDNSSYSYPEHYFNGSHSFLANLPTGLVSKGLLDVYSRIHAAFVVSIPCLILSFVTISILVKLRKRNKKKKNMQTSQTSTNSITLMLVTILITFIVCQLPYFVWYGVGGEIGNPVSDPSLKWLDEKKKIEGCGSFMYYIRLLVDAGLLLNSSANGFIYFFLNKTFREALFSRCPCRRDDGIETIEMGPVNTRQRRDGAHP